MQLTFKDVSSAMEYCLAASNGYKHAVEQNTKIFNNLVEQVWEENKHNLIKKKWFGFATYTPSYYYTDNPYMKEVVIDLHGWDGEIKSLHNRVDFEQAQAEVLEARYNALKVLQGSGTECSVTIDILGEQ